MLGISDFLQEDGSVKSMKEGWRKVVGDEDYIDKTAAPRPFALAGSAVSETDLRKAVWCFSQQGGDMSKMRRTP